nr:putative ribonuclease H-like domain-containing protein [Tanacetum cinerariifolium]
MEILIQTCLMSLTLKTQNDSFIFVHELKQEMHADLKYVESLEKEIDELDSDKAEFSNMYDMILQECVSNDVMCSYLISMSDLDALAELQCLYLHKVKECDCLAQKLLKQTESVKNDTVWNKQASNVFQKQREQYIGIQDLKAQLQDKNISISKLKELIEKGKGKSVDTKFDKPSVVRQPNAQRIPKPSVLVTTHTLPQTARQAVSNTNVLKPGMYRIDNRTTQTRASQSPQTIRNTNPRVSTSTGVNHKTNVNRPQYKSNQLSDKVMPNNSQVKIVQLILFIVYSGCTKHMTGNLKLLCNFVEKFLGTIRFGKDQFAPILGYGDLVQGNIMINMVYYVEGLNHNLFSVGQFCDANLEVAFMKSTCFVRDLQGNDLLIAHAHILSQQELDLLFGPLYDEFFNAGSNLQDRQPTMNIQPTSAPSTPTYVHAEENKDNQAKEEHVPDDEFTNPFYAPVQEGAESSSHNIGVIDSGCSRHMTGNMSYLFDFKELNGGYVAFGGNLKGGKIPGKGKIRTGKLDFDDVYFVKELKFNLFSVSQMCDKKNNVFFTDTECLVLSHEFKLPDDKQVLLRVPRENNIYNVNLKNIVPSRDLTCLFAKVIIDETNIWHRRLGHINSKTMNKLVKGNLVRGLPTKVFENNNTCVACKKGKQHRASCKTKPNTDGDAAFDEKEPEFDEKKTDVNKVNDAGTLVPAVGQISPYSTNIFSAAGPSNVAASPTHEKSSCIDTSQLPDDHDMPELEDITYSDDEDDVGAEADFNNLETSITVNTSQLPDDHDMPELEDITYSDDEDDVGAEADFNNLETSITVSPIPITRVHKDHLVTQIIGDLSLATQTRSMTRVARDQEPKRVHQALKDPSWFETMQEELLQFKMQKVWVLVDLPHGKRAIGTKWVFMNKKDKRGIVVRNKARLVAQGHTQEEGIDYEEVFAPVARIEVIRLFLAYASFMGFMVYQMDIKSAFLYGTIEEEVYVCQPLGFKDPDYPDKVYTVVKALYDLHQAPRALYETLANYLLENGFQRGKIDQTLFIKRQKSDILLVQIYVDDIIFGLTNKDLCKAFEKLMKDKFQMSLMGELTFFLGLQVKQKKDGIFISQDKYIAEILRKFGLTYGKSASTPIDTKKPLLKDPDGKDVDVHTYRSMIGLLMYLTSSRLDIMFAVCACAHF